MKKNDILTGKVLSYGSEGEGIIKTDDGYTVFLPFAIIGEQVRYKVLKVQKKVAFARLEEVIIPASERVRVSCPAFKKCGGCQLLHLKYSSQLQLKRDLIANCFKRVAYVSVKPSKTVASEPELNYRNKLQLPIRNTQDGVKIGFFALNSHRVVDINDCLIHGEWCKKVISVIREFIIKKNISAYDELSNQGLLRHLVVKKIGQKFLIILVINGQTVPSLSSFEKMLKVALGSDYSLFLNVNERNDNVILTDKFIHVSGDMLISDCFMNINYSIGPASFMQVNDGVKTKLYQKVCDVVGECDTVIDAYCGAGLLTALLSKRAKKAIGVEIVSEAIECANILARENQIENTQFICAPCEEALPDLIKQNPNAVIVLDPPRKGLDKKVALAVKEAKPKKIVYVSCSPQTLARDIGVIGGTLCYEDNNLKKANFEGVFEGEVLPNGYKIDLLCGYDMFAQCKGVETLCVLTLQE